MIDTSGIRKNLKIQIDGDPWMVVDFQFVKPGKGQAFTRTKLKNMITGNVIERTYKSGEKLEEAFIEEHEMVFLYAQDNVYHFMNNQTYVAAYPNRPEAFVFCLFQLMKLHPWIGWVNLQIKSRRLHCFLLFVGQFR